MKLWKPLIIAFLPVAGWASNVTNYFDPVVSGTTGGGGTSPATPINSVQYNNAGAFGGSSGLLYFPTSSTLIATNISATNISPTNINVGSTGSRCLFTGSGGVVSVNTDYQCASGSARNSTLSINKTTISSGMTFEVSGTVSLTSLIAGPGGISTSFAGATSRTLCVGPSGNLYASATCP